jgi:hypothetical protein
MPNGHLRAKSKRPENWQPQQALDFVKSIFTPRDVLWVANMRPYVPAPPFQVALNLKYTNYT